MKDIIPSKEFVPLGLTLKQGSTINTFHCKKGESNDRMYITRTKTGKILAFCHHCGRKGMFTEVGTEATTLERVEEILNPQLVTIVPDLKLPSDLLYEYKDWPAVAGAWAFRYDLRMEELIENGFAWSPSLKRMIIPITTIAKGLVGYQTRRIYQWDKGPKYLTYKKENVNIFSEHKAELSKSPNTCVLTEDVLSGIKVSRFIDSVALIGTQVSTALVNHLSTYDNILVFLDDDNHIVKENQLKIQHILSNHVKGNVTIVETDRDPKAYHHAELLQKLVGYLV